MKVFKKFHSVFLTIAAKNCEVHNSHSTFLKYHTLVETNFAIEKSLQNCVKLTKSKNSKKKKENH